MHLLSASAASSSSGRADQLASSWSGKAEQLATSFRSAEQPDGVGVRRLSMSYVWSSWYGRLCDRWDRFSHLRFWSLFLLMVSSPRTKQIPSRCLGTGANTGLLQASVNECPWCVETCGGVSLWLRLKSCLLVPVVGRRPTSPALQSVCLRHGR